MSLPRPTLPGTTYLITRRCSERRLFLNPSALVFQAFVYLVAVAAELFGVQVHAVVVMGNHWHVVVTDPRAWIPEFYGYVHQLTAKVLNTSRGRWEAMWSIEETNRVSLEDLDAVIDKVCYTLLNPVSSELVSRAEKWPGLRAWWGDGPITVARPDVFFTADSKMPESATLTLLPPPQLAALDADAGVARIEAELARRESELREATRRAGRRFIGLRQLKKQTWWESPTSFAARRKLRPRVATKNKWRRIEALQRDRQFVADYREARKHWLAGLRDVIWPVGTYLMRVMHGVVCAEPPPSAATA